MALFVKVNNFPGGVGVPGISLGGEVRPGPLTPNPVKQKDVKLWLPGLRHLIQNHTLCKTFASKKIASLRQHRYPVKDTNSRKPYSERPHVPIKPW